MTHQSTYTVTGMHCASCVMNVEEVMLEISGVAAAKASLEGATVTLTHDGTITDDQARAAIVEAGYQPT